jgi:hypothetical protein
MLSADLAVILFFKRVGEDLVAVKANTSNG